MSNLPAGEEFAKAIVIRAHPSSDDAQLDLKVNDIVYVLERDESGWWGGHKEGEDNTGWFPGSCVRQVQEHFEVEMPAPSEPRIADAATTARPEFSVATFEAETARELSPEQSFIESPRRRVNGRPAHTLATTPTPLVESCSDLPKDELQARIQAKDKEISDLRTELTEAKRRERQSDADLRDLREHRRTTDVERKELINKNDDLVRQVNEQQRQLKEKDADLQSTFQALQHAQSQAQVAQRRASESVPHPPVAQVADAARRQLFGRHGGRESSTSQRLCWPAGEGKISSTNPEDQASNSDAQSSHRETPCGHSRVGGTPLSEQQELPVRGSVAEKVNVFEQRCTTQSPNRNFLPEAVRCGPKGSPIATPTGSWRSASRTRTQESLRATPTCTTKISPSRPLPCIDLALPTAEPDDPTDEGAVVLGMSPIRSARPASKMPTPSMQAHRDASPSRLPVSAQRSPNPRESAVSETSVRDRVRMFGR